MYDRLRCPPPRTCVTHPFSIYFFFASPACPCMSLKSFGVVVFIFHLNWLPLYTYEVDAHKYTANDDSF